jgi:multidrug transporter EmrE-like cation transporter
MADMNERSHTFYRTFSLALAGVFALVGVIFLVIPRGTLAFFNAISRRLGMTEGPVDPSFFVVLAVAYMFVVTLLAWRMYRSPLETAYPLLLAQAKLASSILSFAMFAAAAPWLIFLVNGIVDGGLGLLVLAMYFRVRTGSGGRRAGA